jgi:hypothetical protein
MARVSFACHYRYQIYYPFDFITFRFYQRRLLPSQARAFLRSHSNYAPLEATAGFWRLSTRQAQPSFEDLHRHSICQLYPHFFHLNYFFLIWVRIFFIATESSTPPKIWRPTFIFCRCWYKSIYLIRPAAQPQFSEKHVLRSIAWSRQWSQLIWLVLLVSLRDNYLVWLMLK